MPIEVYPTYEGGGIFREGEHTGWAVYIHGNTTEGEFDTKQQAVNRARQMNKERYDGEAGLKITDLNGNTSWE